MNRGPTRRVLLAGAGAAALSPMLPSVLAARDRRAIAPARLAGASDLIERLVEEGKLAGAAVRVSQYGEVLIDHVAGAADLESGRPIARDTIYRAYSMTKPVTAAAVMALVDDGALSLDDPVAQYAPEFSDLVVAVSQEGGELVTEPARPMRVIDTLAHTSGVSNSWNPGLVSPLYREAGLVSGEYLHDPAFENGLDEFAARLSRLPLQFQPGTRWLYSFAPDISGLIVERVSGRRFGAFLKERIFDPLAMTDTDFYVPADKKDRLASMYALKDGALVLAEAGEGSVFLKEPFVESGSAGLVSTLDDYGRFAAMLAGLGRLGDVRVLSEEAARTMMASHVDAEVLGASLDRFMAFGAGGQGGGYGAALGGVVLADPDKSPTGGLKGEYGWGGAASTTFFSAPEMGLEATLMTQLFPSGTLPLRDELKKAVYAALD